MITDDDVNTYERDGVVLIKGLFCAEQIEQLRRGVAQNMAQPGQFAAENTGDDDTGRFFDDYCNWSRIAEFEALIRTSAVADVAAALMRSTRVQLFHDHVLVKEPGTSKATPWHQDSPYYLVEAQQCVSLWCPLDPVSDATLRCVAGSHRWDKPVQPTRWLSQENFYEDEDSYQAVPDPDSDNMQVREWPMQPGDAVAFHFATLHGARGNQSDTQRRAFSLRLVGDDARVIDRPGPTSPPFTGHGMQPGEQLREDWFPVLLP